MFCFCFDITKKMPIFLFRLIEHKWRHQTYRITYLLYVSVPFAITLHIDVLIICFFSLRRQGGVQKSDSFVKSIFSSHIIMSNPSFVQAFASTGLGGWKLHCIVKPDTMSHWSYHHFNIFQNSQFLSHRLWHSFREIFPCSRIQIYFHILCSRLNLFFLNV